MKNFLLLFFSAIILCSCNSEKNSGLVADSSLASRSGDCDSLTEPVQENELERTYHSIAVDSALDELCAKIDSQAYGSWWLNPVGKQIGLTRSRCYFGIAIYHNRPELCQNVRTISAGQLDGSFYSVEGCLKAVADTTPGKPALSVGKDRLLQFLAEVGLSQSSASDECDGYIAEFQAGETFKEMRPENTAADPAASQYAVRERLFGPFYEKRTHRKHWLCESFYEVRVSPDEKVTISRRPESEATERFRSNIFALYRAKIQETEIMERISALPCTRSHQ